METLQELIRRLRKAGAKSDATRGCGVHIHIGAKGHTPQSLRNLANIMASHESLLASALNLDRSRMSRYCRTVSKDFLVELNRKKPKTMAALADTWYGSQNADYGRSAHYNESRYHMLNLHATFTKGTIEFRLFQFDAPANGKQNGLHAGQLKSYIQLCLALSQLAKQVKTASANPQQTENPKYAIIVIFRFSGALLPNLVYSGRNSVSFIPCAKAYSLAEVSTPLAPPDTISVVFSGRYLPKSLTLSPLEPITATFMSPSL